jgi:hypothetical protein
MISRRHPTNHATGLGIGVGTTFGKLSYSILAPGVIPIVQGVNRWVSDDSLGLSVDKIMMTQLRSAEQHPESNLLENRIGAGQNSIFLLVTIFYAVLLLQVQTETDNLATMRWSQSNQARPAVL